MDGTVGNTEITLTQTLLEFQGVYHMARQKDPIKFKDECGWSFGNREMEEMISH